MANGHLMKTIPKHLEKLNRGKLRILYVIFFLFSFSIAFLSYTQSSFLETVIPKESVGLVFVVGYIVTLIAMTWLGTITAWLGKRDALVAILVLLCAALLLLITGRYRVFLLVAFVLYTVGVWLAYVALDLLVETYSSDKETGRIRGTQLTIGNAGWVIAPTLSGFVLEQFGFPTIFSISLLLMLPVVGLVVVGFRGLPRRETMRVPPFMKTMKEILARPSLLRIFLISFLLYFFYAWMVIYTPLYLLSIGIDWSDIGKIFSVMLLPFILFQYPAGTLADRRLGERRILLLGLVIIGVSTIGLYFIEGPILWLWALLLFCTRVGASLVEIMRDSYFFKQVDKRDVQLIEFFRNTYPLAYIVGPLLATAILAVAPMHSLFLVLGIIMLSGTVFAFQLVDTK